MTRAFGVISLEDWVLELCFSNLWEKLAKQEVMVSIIFITSPKPGSVSRLFDCLAFQFPLPCPLSLLRIRFLQCMKFIAIRSCESLDSTMVAKMLNLRTSLRLQKRIPYSLRFSHKWVLRFCQNLLNSSIWLLLNLHILNNWSWYHWFLSFNKLHLLGHIGAWTTFSSVS